MLFWHKTLLLFLMYLAILTPHPVMLSALLVSFAAIVGLLLNTMISQWLMVSILLIFLGGMMVIFLYCSFMSSENKMLVNISFTTSSLLIFSAIMILQNLFTNTDSSILFEVALLSQNMTKQIMIFMLFYLLLSLCLAVFFTKSFKGAMSKLDF